MKLSTIIILFVFIISLIMAAINAALSKVKNPIHIRSIGFLFKRRKTIASHRVRLNAVFRLSVYAFVLSLLWCGETLAQSCANYAPVTRATGITYNSIAGSGPSFFTWRNTTLNQNDDNRSYPIPIGFDFWYLGVRYTQISGSLNGTLDFSTSTSDGNNGGTGPYGPNYNNLFSTANQTMLALAPLYADWWTANAGTTPIAISLAYQVSGSAPNRVLTVEWINFDEWNSPVNVPPASINMQVKIYETTGTIEFIYGTMTAGASGGGSYPLRYTCGINNTWSVGAPNVTQLLSQQVANSTTFNNTPQNALTTLPTTNSKLTFTPPVPTAAPTELTFTAITQSGMTLNWTDNATNEVGYAVYNSTDNVNFNFVSQVTAGSTSATVTNLTSSTTYYWKVYAVTDGALSPQLTGSQATLPAGTITSIANGNWNATGTWDCGCVPTAGDNVIIANGTTVTLDINGSCNSLTVGQGVNGQLIIGNDATARTLTVVNDAIINSGGTIITGATAATHIMNIGGNLTNNGTLNLAPTGTRVCNVTFNKNGNQTITGTGVTTNFNRITLNMGTSNFNVLDVASSNFTATANFLTLTNGIFKLSTGAAVTPFTGNVTIPSSSGIWLDNTAANLSTTGGTITLYGLLRATTGTMNIGNAANNNLTSYGGTITIDGGTVNIAGRLDRAGPTILTYFTMSSGTLTVATVGSTTTGAAPFRIDEVGSTFNMFGGTIIIRRPGAGNLGYVNTGGTVGIVSGGTLQIGDASTPAAQTIQINSSIAVPNLVIGNGVAVTAQLVTNSLFVNDDISINSGTLNANGLNITLGGNWTNNGGIFTPGTGTVTLNGTANQTLTGATIFYNLTVNNIAGITIASNQTVNWILTLTNGIITTNSNSIILPSSGSVTRSQGYVNGNLQKYIPTAAPSQIFEVGSGSYSPVTVTFTNMTTAGNLTVRATGNEHPNISTSALDNTKSVNRYWTLTNSGIAFTTYNAAFTFVAGDIDAGASAGNFSVGQYITSAWSLPIVGTRTSTTTQITGVSSFGDFAIGEKKTYSILASAGTGGTISPSGTVTVTHGNDQSFSIAANAHYHISDVLVDTISQGAVSSYTFTNVTAVHTIAVSFALDTYTLTVNATNGTVAKNPDQPTYNHGTSIELTATPAVGYHFVDWTGDATGSANPVTVTMDGNKNITANFAINTYTINSTAGANGDISPSGNIIVNHGGNQTFTITPDVGYNVADLFVDGVHQDSIAGYTFYNVTANHTINVAFSINLYTINATASAGGTIVPNDSVTVPHGGSQQFIISSDQGYHFIDLFVDGIHSDSTISYTFENVVASHTIHAGFAINTYTLNITANNGTVAKNPDQLTYDHGTNVELTAIPSTGYSFIDWTGDATGSVNPVIVTMDGNKNITANFAINTYTINSTAGANGDISPSGNIIVNHGGNQTFTITPDVGYNVADLFVDGVHQDSIAGYTFYNVTANHTINVAFSINLYTINATASAGGTIVPNDSVTVPHGGSQQFIISSDQGYHFIDLFVDGIHSDSTISYTFENVVASHTIHAGFAINTYTLNITANNGTVAKNPDQLTYDHGTNVELTAIPSTGYSFIDWTGDATGSVNPVIVTMDGNKNITANFGLNSYTITATAGLNGSINPSGSIVLNHGADQSFSMSANLGYHIADVLVDGISVGAVTSYDFNDVSSNHTIEISFEINLAPLTRTIIATAGSHGAIDPAGVIVVTTGDDQAFSITPDEGYHVASLMVDSIHQDSTTSYTFYDVVNNHSIDVAFAIDMYAIIASASAGGTIVPTDTVAVPYGASQSFAVIPNPGYHLIDLFVDGIHQDSIVSYTFDDVKANHTIHADFGINTYTISASAGIGGTIDPSGVLSVDFGASRTFLITSDAGYQLDGLFVDGIHTDSTTSYTFINVTDDHTINATFIRAQFTITATAGGGGSISPSGGVTVLRGGTQRFTFTPNAGYHLDELQVDGLHQDSATGYTFQNVTDDHTIDVSFAIDTYIISATAGSNGTIDPEGNINISYGSNRTFTFLPEPGYHVDSLFVDFVHVDSTTSYTFYNVNSYHAIHVTFAIDKFTITAGSSAGGTIDPSGIVVVDFGEDKEFSFEPNTGYNFDSLFVDGSYVDSAARYTFSNIIANHTIYAKFAVKRLMITATASAGGTIAPSGVASVNFGENKIFIVTPNTGYNIDSIFVDGEYVDSTISYTFYNVEENHLIYAKFAIKKFAITATADTGGSITPNGIINVNYGASQRFTVAPDVGYDFAELTVDGAHVDSTLSYTFINITTVHSVHATFVIQKFTITASAGTGGTITPSGSVQVNYGDSILFTMHPQTGYIVDSIFVDDIYVDNDTVYNMENVITNHTIHVTFTFEDDVKNELSQIPKEFALHQNYPNPFNPSTMIQFDLPQRSVVTLKVYNLIGSDVLTLIDNRVMEAGVEIVEINSQNLASGLYFYRIVAEGADGQNFISVRRMIILK